MESLGWYLRLILDVRSIGAAAAVPTLLALDLRRSFARFVLDHPSLIGAIDAERTWRQMVGRVSRRQGSRVETVVFVRAKESPHPGGFCTLGEERCKWCRVEAARRGE